MQKVETIGPGTRSHAPGACKSESTGKSVLERDTAIARTVQASLFIWSDGHSVERLRTIAEGWA